MERDLVDQHVELWSGRYACLLQSALRLTNEQFATRLGIAVRTVAAWHSDAAVVPRREMQQLLDTAHEQAERGDGDGGAWQREERRDERERGEDRTLERAEEGLSAVHGIRPQREFAHPPA